LGAGDIKAPARRVKRTRKAQANRFWGLRVQQARARCSDRPRPRPRERSRVKPRARMRPPGV
jgi:hypothetical protein